MKALLVGGNRFVGHELALRLVAAGHRLTLFNRGTLQDALADRVERLHGDRTTGDFERLLAGRRFGLLGDPGSFGRADNLAQDETPTLAELLTALAAALGATPRLVELRHETVRAAGLDPLALSPFSGSWMSFIDPALAKAELGFRHEPLASYLDKIVAAFLAHPPATPPPGYEQREKERQLAV